MFKNFIKTLLIITCLLSLLVPVSQAKAQSRAPKVTIYVRNLSPQISQAELEDDLTAFQWVLDHQLQKYWHINAILTTIPVQGSWTITIMPGRGDCSIGGCILGTHAVSRYGHPYAVLFLETIHMFQHSWEETFTHELFEMIVDPMIDKKVNDGVLDWLVEVSDPVVGYRYSIPTKSGRWVPIADFVTPAWYRRGTKWPYDLMGRLRQPRYLTKEGYAAYWSILFAGRFGWVPVDGPGSLDSLVRI